MTAQPNAETSFTTPSNLEIVCERVFDAPRELVFKVSNDPDLVPRWWGPARLETSVERMEVRHGGVWRVLQREASGTVHAFRGVYHEVNAPERVIRTFEYEPFPGHVALETATYEDLGGKTRIRVQTVFQSQPDRDGMMQSGAEEGARESHDRLAALLEEATKAQGKG